MKPDIDHFSLDHISHELKKRVVIAGEALMNVMEEFEEGCTERSFLLNPADVKNFVKLMKFNIDNLVIQVTEILKKLHNTPQN